MLWFRKWDETEQKGTNVAIWDGTRRRGASPSPTKATLRPAGLWGFALLLRSDTAQMVRRRLGLQRG